jgi:hypothetical protein
MSRASMASRHLLTFGTGTPVRPRGPRDLRWKRRRSPVGHALHAAHFASVCRDDPASAGIGRQSLPYKIFVRTQKNSLLARLAGVQCVALNGSTPARNSWHSPMGRGGISIPQTTRFLALWLPHDPRGSPAMRYCAIPALLDKKVLEVWFRRHPKIAGKTLRTPNDDTTSAVEKKAAPCRPPVQAGVVSGAREFSRRARRAPAVT